MMRAAVLGGTGATAAGGRGARVGARAADDPLCTFPGNRRHLRKHRDSPAPEVVDFETLTVGHRVDPGRRALKPCELTFVHRPMPDTLIMPSMPSVFSPLAKALLDGFSEGVVVFDAEGRLLYANQPARLAMEGLDLSEMATDLQPRLAAMGGRLRPLRVGGMELGEAMFIPGIEGPTTLAAREKEAIVKTLDAHNWKLAETARHLGISRTTLWRRLKAYGLHRDGRSKWAQST